MASIAWRSMFFWVFSASFTPGRWSAKHPLCHTQDKRESQEETGRQAWRANTGQRDSFLDQAEDLSHREWVKCKNYFRVNSDPFDTNELAGSPLYRDMEQHLSFDTGVEGLSTTPTLRPATEARPNKANLRRMRTLPTEDPRRLAAGAGAAEDEGVELSQPKERITHSLVYAPDTECDDFWSTWPAVQERAITDGTVFVFEVFSSVGNLFLALEHVMQLVRLLDLGLVLTWSKFPGFREAFDPAEINWSVDPAPFTEPTVNMETGTNATGLHSMVFDNYAMVLSDVQLELMALKLGVTKPTTEDLAIHFKETFPRLFHAFMTELMGPPFLLHESPKTSPCAWNMLLRRSRSMMASMEEHSPWPAVADDSGLRTTPPEYIAWHIRTSEGETAQSYNPLTHPYVIQEPASDVCPTYLVAMEDAIQAVLTCGTPSSLDTTGALPVYISSNSKRMAKECTLEAADHDMFMGHVDLGLSEGDAHTGYSRNPRRTAVSAFLDFLYLMDSKAIVRTGSSFSGTVAGIKGLKCHARIYDSLPHRALFFCIPSAC